MSPSRQQKLCSDARATDRSSANRAKTERSGNSCSAAPERRTWRINLSLHYLSNCINKKPDVIFRRGGKNAMPQTANPAGPGALFQRPEIIIEMLFQIVTRRVQQGLIEVALHKAAGRNIECCAYIPAMIDSDSSKAAIAEKRVAQMRRLRSFRIIANL